MAIGVTQVSVQPQPLWEDNPTVFNDDCVSGHEGHLTVHTTMQGLRQELSAHKGRHLITSQDENKCFSFHWSIEQTLQEELYKKN